ncbi:hypothetical protein NCCP2716_29810 [Sporosarcina sp. NCCP-2716]|nr:hypothetical protein NCCP2716_29810 [Sporosarcina sp. NCCP-2716]
MEREGISILPGFTEQVELVRAYYRKYYFKNKQRLVFCGINPGQFGAGRTGVPFIDFDGIEKLMPGRGGDEQERSAQYMLSIMEEYETGAFQDSVYLTNLSWYGFVRRGRNLNYYSLPRHVRHYFTNMFVEEMKIVQPSYIVPLSEEVGRELRLMKANGQLDFPIAERLPHPLHCSFPSNVEKSRDRYHSCIEKLTGLRRKNSVPVARKAATAPLNPTRFKGKVKLQRKPVFVKQ